MAHMDTEVSKLRRGRVQDDGVFQQADVALHRRYRRDIKARIHIVLSQVDNIDRSQAADGTGAGRIPSIVLSGGELQGGTFRHDDVNHIGQISTGVKGNDAIGIQHIQLADGHTHSHIGGIKRLAIVIDYDDFTVAGHHAEACGGLNGSELCIVQSQLRTIVQDDRIDVAEDIIREINITVDTNRGLTGGTTRQCQQVAGINGRDRGDGVDQGTCACVDDRQGVHSVVVGIQITKVDGLACGDIHIDQSGL